MPIKSFRGKIAGDGTEIIPLHTNTGSQGYRIVKLDVMPGAFTGDQVGIFKVNTIARSPTSTVDFSDQTLIGVALVRTGNLLTEGYTQDVVFDNTTFNQDIHLSFKNLDAAIDMNYYIELELIRLDLNENTMATLKDIRNFEGVAVVP
jgi:hypothetical protein